MLTITQIAERAEISPDTVRHHHKMATRARRDGAATERHLPAPVGVDGGANVWDETAIDEWIETRREPARRGGIPKSEMRAVLAAAENHNIDQVISIARRNLA